jgi:hypothetical protein
MARRLAVRGHAGRATLAQSRAQGDGHAVLVELVAGHKIGAPEIHEPLRVPPPVPTTSICSRTDGVVAWQCCIEKKGPRTGNIEVEASHFRMGLNPAALYAIADRLARPGGRWRPFDRGDGMRAWIYRDPRRRGWF